MKPIGLTNNVEVGSLVGLIESIEKVGTNDILFRVESETRTFYINRGLEKSLTIENVSKELIEKVETFTCLKYWTPMYQLINDTHILKIEVNDRLYFSNKK